jgi:hypothetical protein
MGLVPAQQSKPLGSISKRGAVVEVIMRALTPSTVDFGLFSRRI